MALWPQLPVLGSHASAVQPLPSSQFLAGPALQVPPLHTSPILHGLWSSHAAALGAALQLPLCGSQASVVHKLPSSQTLALPALHAPLLHVSPTVHESPSLQLAALLLWLQVPPLQLSSVHGLPSSQFTLAPCLQAPNWQ